MRRGRAHPRLCLRFLLEAQRPSCDPFACAAQRALHALCPCRSSPADVLSLYLPQRAPLFSPREGARRAPFRFASGDVPALWRARQSAPRHISLSCQLRPPVSPWPRHFQRRQPPFPPSPPPRPLYTTHRPAPQYLRLPRPGPPLAGIFAILRIWRTTHPSPTHSTTRHPPHPLPPPSPLPLTARAAPILFPSAATARKKHLAIRGWAAPGRFTHCHPLFEHNQFPPKARRTHTTHHTPHTTHHTPHTPHTLAPSPTRVCHLLSFVLRAQPPGALPPPTTAPLCAVGTPLSLVE